MVKSHCLSHSISLVLPAAGALLVFDFSDRGTTPGHRFPLTGAGTPPPFPQRFFFFATVARLGRMRFQRGTRPAAGAARSEDGGRRRRAGLGDEAEGGEHSSSPCRQASCRTGIIAQPTPSNSSTSSFLPTDDGPTGTRSSRIRGMAAAPQRAEPTETWSGARHVFDGDDAFHGCEFHGPALRGQAINIDRRRRISEGPRPAPSATQGRSEARCRKKVVRNARKKAVSRPLD